MTAPTLIESLRRPIVRVNAEVALLCEAALRAATEIERLRKELNDQEREFQRESRSIAAEARHEVYADQRGESYGTY